MSIEIVLWNPRKPKNGLVLAKASLNFKNPGCCHGVTPRTSVRRPFGVVHVEEQVRNETYWIHLSDRHSTHSSFIQILLSYVPAVVSLQSTYIQSVFREK